MWRPKEIIINEKVKDDPVTAFFVSQCKGIPISYVKTGHPKPTFFQTTADSLQRAIWHSEYCLISDRMNLKISTLCFSLKLYLPDFGFLESENLLGGNIGVIFSRYPNKSEPEVKIEFRML